MAHSRPHSPVDEKQQQQSFELNLQHGHKDLVQAVAFNTYGDRCATGSVDGKIRVFNRHKDGTWRICDTWTAHGGQVLELQWLPATVYPNVLASLGIEGWFRLWAEDPSATPGRRFCSGRTSTGRPIFDTRSSRSNNNNTSIAGAGGNSSNNTGIVPSSANPSTSSSTYRSFSMKHNDETKHTYLALLTTSGRLVVYETEQPEAINDYTLIDEFLTIPQRPQRGEETSFKCVFDPNPEPCYAALRAGVPTDALGLAVAAMDVVKIYRSRDVVGASYGVDVVRKEFYLAVEVSDSHHRGLVRDIAWAAGNIRGYDMIATACQDGYARVFRIDTPMEEGGADGGKKKSWAVGELVTPGKSWMMQQKQKLHHAKSASGSTPSSTSPTKEDEKQRQHQQQHHPSTLSASLANKANSSHSTASNAAAAAAAADMRLRAGGSGGGGGHGSIQHTAREISKLDNHRTPVWRVGFDDDGQILGTTGDDGKLLCYRQTPDGSWAKSAEMVMMKTRMAAP